MTTSLQNHAIGAILGGCKAKKYKRKLIYFVPNFLR